MTYWVGTGATLAVLIAIAWAAWRVRQRLLPHWWGAPARLAECVLAVGWLVLVAEALGTAGHLTRWPMFAALVVGALVAGGLARPVSGPEVRTDAVDRTRREEVVVAGVGVAVVAAQWVAHVAAAYHRGMTHPDTLWYHGPFAARFVQSGRLFTSTSTGLDGLATPTHALWPLDASLVHAIVALPYDGDFLSPLVNLGWAAVALLSAWCIGRRVGGGAIAVLGAAVVLGLPAIAGTNPGQAANDVMSAGLCLAAIALLLEARWAPVGVAVAAAAAGLAIGTKLTMAIPIAVLTVAVLVHAVRSASVRAGAAWCGTLALVGGFWFVRDWIVVGNPFPWWSLRVGPIGFDAVVHDRDPIGQYLFDGSVWHRYFWPGLADGFGRFWPLFIVLGLAGATWGLVRGQTALHRWAGAAAWLGGLGYLVTPKNGELGGAVFVLTIRFLAFTYFVGFALLAVALRDAPVVARRAAYAALLLLVIVNAVASQHEGLPAWPKEGIAAGVAAGLLLVLCALRPRLAPMVAAGAAVVFVLAAPLLRDHYLDHRYAHAGLDLDYIDAVLVDTHHERVATFRTEQLYPMFGDDLSNIVTKMAVPADGNSCGSWRRALRDGGYTYVVIGHGGGFTVDDAPQPEWLTTDPSVHVVATDGSSALYRIDGAMHPEACPP